MKLLMKLKGLEKLKIHQKSKISECAQKSKAFPTFQRKLTILVLLVFVLSTIAISAQKEVVKILRDSP